MNPMRILVSASVVLLATALSLPSAACDRHGGGMYGQFGGASWADYNPTTADSDALLEEKLSEWHKKTLVPEAKPKAAKPTFSKVSSRASIAAKARLAKQAKLTAQDEVQPTSTAKLDGVSEVAPR